MAFIFCCLIVSISNNVLLTGKYYDEFEKVTGSDKTIEDIIPKLAKIKDSLPEVAENDVEYHRNHQVIAVNGYWYNVKGFLDSHPGGPIIK